jgi:hypothetical protein
MKTIERIIAPSFTQAGQPEEPEEIRITLRVCSCYKHDQLTLITNRASKVASLLGISIQQLECHAITAMLTGNPQVVACYKQHDLAEQKLAQLEAETPFISRPCHSFDLSEET